MPSAQNHRPERDISCSWTEHNEHVEAILKESSKQTFETLRNCDEIKIYEAGKEQRLNALNDNNTEYTGTPITNWEVASSY